MKWLDHFLQNWRISVVKSHIPPNVHLLDIGCHNGALFYQLAHKLSSGIGIDPALKQSKNIETFQLISGTFPHDLERSKPFDVITMLAVFEHLPPKQQRNVISASFKYLRPGGSVVLTIPSPLVDPLLDMLRTLRMVEGMSVEEHYGFHPKETPGLFQKEGFEMEIHRRFQLGLNNLFVFRKPTM